VGLVLASLDVPWSLHREKCGEEDVHNYVRLWRSLEGASRPSPEGTEIQAGGAAGPRTAAAGGRPQGRP
jgi:hypothetical protein